MSAFTVAPPAAFSTPPDSPLSENDSRFSPTSDGVFDPTEPAKQMPVVTPTDACKSRCASASRAYRGGGGGAAAAAHAQR